MHPVIAKLGVARRREFFANPYFAASCPNLRVQLLDAVLKVRASLDHRTCSPSSTTLLSHAPTPRS